MKIMALIGGKEGKNIYGHSDLDLKSYSCIPRSNKLLTQQYMFDI
jgi:hypothetical protein